MLNVGNAQGRFFEILGLRVQLDVERQANLTITVELQELVSVLVGH